ncbi:polysaccharide biosynthesis C-terminal domain-containing protein [Hellea sp.]|nr:polysaccharide biosynthesis C-terminal domain-containing protein [Hellea sp.]
MMGRSMLAYIPVNLANIIVSFGTIVVLTRLLNGEEFGRYALAMITMQFAHMGLFTWLEAAMARFQARAEREGDVNSHLKTIYAYAVACGAAGFALMMVVLWALPLSQIMKTLLVATLASTTLQIFFNLGMEAHRAAHRIRRYSFTYSTQMLMSFTIGILLIMTTPLREIAPFIGIIIALLVTLAIDLPFMLKQMKGGVTQPAKANTYFRYGMPICISLLLAYALNSADMYLIAGMMGEASAGQYNAGYNLANRSLEILFVWISMAATPIAVTLMEKEGVEGSRQIMKDYGASLLWIAMPAATGIALVSKEFGFILGESVRAEAITVMPLIAFAGVLNGLISYYAQRAFMLSGKTSMFMWAMVPPVVLNIDLNIWLIPIYGLMGAVYATVISYALGFVLAIIVGRRFYPLPIPFRAVLEIGFACGCMALSVLALPDLSQFHDFIALGIKAITGASVYAIVCMVINAANSRSFIKNLVEKRQLKAVTP